MSDYLIAHIGHTTKHCDHITWWKPDSRGYTICTVKAGRYSEDEASSICRIGSCIAVRLEDVEPITRTTPYYRLGNGTLAKLYDGGPHCPVDNEAQAWRHLMSRRLPRSDKPERPTPISRSKARAIYLDMRPPDGETT